MEKEMDVVTKQSFLQGPPEDHPVPVPIPIPGLGCCPCCPCCDCCGCCDGGCCDGCSCPSCDSCCCCCPDCCCPPSCACCCRACCFLPGLLCRLPKLPSCPIRIKRVLIILIVIILVVVIIVGALLMGLHVTQAHPEMMTIKGLPGGEQLDLPMEMDAATFLVNDGVHEPATIIYDFSKLLIGYKARDGQACYLERMDKGNVQGLDATLKEFQVKLSAPSPAPSGKEQKEVLLASLVDRFSLGTAINILCSHMPILWA